MYRDDEAARVQRARSLIDEIAGLERQKVDHAATEQRLEDARRELEALRPPPEGPPVTRPGAAVHLLVFAVTAGAAFLGYTLLAN